MKSEKPTPLSPPLSRGKRSSKEALRDINPSVSSTPSLGRETRETRAHSAPPLTRGGWEGLGFVPCAEMKSEKPTPLNPPLSGGRRSSKEALRDINPSVSSSPLSDRETRETRAHSAPPLTRGGWEGLGFIPYNKKLTAFARENRKNPTAAESKMWNGVLRMHFFADYKFLRQKPIGSFIVDFYCSALRLAIEIDGDSHAEARGYDAARTAALDACCITVVRYTNSEVMKNLAGVYDDLVRRVVRISEGVA